MKSKINIQTEKSSSRAQEIQKFQEFVDTLAKITNLAIALHEEVGEIREEINILTQKVQNYSKINNQIEDIERLKACIQVLSFHISILEKKNRKFSDKFKFGRFKFKSIDEEDAFNKDLKELQEKKKPFFLNDD